jgi:hypothetical protein
MKAVLVTAAIIGLTASSAFAECGHDMVKTETTQTVATVDMSTTASTTAETTDEATKPVEAK